MTAPCEEAAQNSGTEHFYPNQAPLPESGPLLRPSITSQFENPSRRALRRALIVMAKQPVAGNAKTRLVPPLTSASAASLYHCFLQDVLATVRAAACQVPFTPVIAYTPASARDFFRRLAPDFWLINQQRTISAAAAAPQPESPGQLPEPLPEPLGDRLNFVLSASLNHGFRRVAAINSDSPTLPSHLLCSAFQRLDDPQVDAVFGPCADGGYYLIGVKSPPGHLVTDVQMSTPNVLSDTLAVADEEGTCVDLLPEWYDVDSAADLDRLADELALHPERAPNTSRFLTNTWTST